jgi:uncharacterized membrane protein YfcA
VDKERGQQRAATVLGFISGVMLALLIDYGGYVLWSDRYPKGYTTFVLIAVGAFLGMNAADRLGARAIKVLSMTAGLLLAALLLVLFLPVGR